MTAVNREYSTDHGAPGAFAEASSDGGPAVVDYLDAQFANASDLPSGAVVEVR